MNYNKFLILLSILLISGLTNSCSRNFSNQDLSIKNPSRIAKVTGLYKIYIPKKKLELDKNFSSEDCESWSVELDLDGAYRNALNELIIKMFKESIITNEEPTKSELLDSNIIALIKIKHDNAKANFITQRNTGKFEISFRISIDVIQNKKNIQNVVNSQRTWQKNIYLNCKLIEGARTSAEKGLENILQQIHSSIYESVFKINR